MKVKKKPRRNSVDFSLLLSTFLLISIGIMMVFSSSWPVGIQEFNNGYFFFRKQLISALIGLVGMFILMNIDYKIWQKLSLPIISVGILVSLLVFTSKGKNIKGATRWVEIAGFSFMPSDILKIASIIFMADLLDKKSRYIKSFTRAYIPIMAYIGGLAVLVYLQRDLGTAITLVATLMAMYFVGGLRISQLLLTIFATVPGIVFIIQKTMKNPNSKNYFRIKRLISFKDPFADKLDTGMQAVQSLYALGSGGVFGLGLGKSRQKFFYLPEAYNDFIFAILGEELGFIGGFMVISLYLILIYRGVRISMTARDKFGSYLSAGISALIAIQAFINIGVVTSSIPTTGITLPFISAGGTSLIIYMCSIGILLNISRYSQLDRS